MNSETTAILLVSSPDYLRIFGDVSEGGHGGEEELLVLSAARAWAVWVQKNPSEHEIYRENQEKKNRKKNRETSWTRTAQPRKDEPGGGVSSGMFRRAAAWGGRSCWCSLRRGRGLKRGPKNTRANTKSTGEIRGGG